MSNTFHENPWDLFPEHRHLGTDECGNEILVDRTNGADGPVYGLWHDPPAIVVLARTAAAFREVAPGFGAGHQAVPEAIEKLIALPGATEPMSREAALTALDGGLHDWIMAFSPETRFVDLRPAVPGSGFSWDLRDTFAKHPSTAVFAVHSPPKPRGWLARLFGG